MGRHIGGATEIGPPPFDGGVARSGDGALAWMDARAPSYGPMLRRFQRLFGKAAWPLVLLAPNNFLVVADLVLLPAVDLRVERLALNLIAVAILLYGFIWELD